MHGELVVCRVGLRHVADGPVRMHGAFHRGAHPRQTGQQGGFSARIRPEHREYFAGAGLQLHPAK